MIKFQLLFILLVVFTASYGQGVIVNPDGTHSVVTGSIIVNPNGTHSTIHGSVVVNPNGTHSILTGSTLINPNGTTSILTAAQKKDDSNSSFPNTTYIKNSKFNLTASGFVNSANNSLKYVLIKYTDISKNELYNRAISYFSTNFYPKKILLLSNIKDESITINVVENRIPIGEYNGKINLDYTITIEFRDDELRILAPSINRITQYINGSRFEIGLTGSYNERTVFNQNGNLILKQPKQMLDLAAKNWTDRMQMF